MTHPAALTDSPLPDRKASGYPVRQLALAAIVFWWLGLLLRFGRLWNSQVDYTYGWAVPLLALGLFLGRWRRRPAPSGDRIWGGYSALMIGPTLFLVLALPVLEANPTWPTILWPSAVAGVAIILGLVGFLGGRTWVRHFLIPICFILLSLPWPAIVIGPLMQSLREINALFAADAVTVLGHPAVAHGTVVEVATGLVGIDEACSGLRSLQSVIMASLFFGEFYDFTAKRRIWLMVAGLFLAVASNLCRTIFLTWTAASRGTAAMMSWHDPAGYIELGFSLAGLWILALLLKKPEIEDPEGATRPNVDWRRFPVGVAMFMIVAYVVAEAGTQFWYGSHEQKPEIGRRWVIDSSSASARPVAIAPGVRDILKCDFAAASTWQDGPAHSWLSYYFRWQGNVASRGLPEIHSPDVCLPAAGARMEENLGTILVEAGGLKLPYRFYHFRDNGHDYHVFFCLWDFRDGKSVIGEGSTSADLTRYRLRHVRDGRRTVDLAESEIVLFGAKSDAEAVTSFRAMLPTVLKAEKRSLD